MQIESAIIIPCVIQEHRPGESGALCVPGERASPAIYSDKMKWSRCTALKPLPTVSDCSRMPIMTPPNCNSCLTWPLLPLKQIKIRDTELRSALIIHPKLPTQVRSRSHAHFCIRKSKTSFRLSKPRGGPQFQDTTTN